MGHRGAPVVGVIGCTGGVGASTFACALAIAARAGLLVDLDSCGGGLDTALGIEGTSGTRWAGLRVAGGVIDPVDLSRGLPHWHGVPVLAADGTAPAQATITAVFDAGRALGPVVVDVGRCLCADTASVVRQCDVGLIIVEAEARGVAAVHAIAGRLDGVPLALVARRGALPRAELQALTGLPVLGMLPPLGRRPGMRIPRVLLRVASAVASGVEAEAPRVAPVGHGPTEAQ